VDNPQGALQMLFRQACVFVRIGLALAIQLAAALFELLKGDLAGREIPIQLRLPGTQVRDLIRPRLPGPP